jgi:hypothetical protein
MYDLQIQHRIRQITDKMLKRRNETQRNPFEEKRQAKLELLEVNNQYVFQFFISYFIRFVSLISKGDNVKLKSILILNRTVGI